MPFNVVLPGSWTILPRTSRSASISPRSSKPDRPAPPSSRIFPPLDGCGEREKGGQGYVPKYPGNENRPEDRPALFRSRAGRSSGRSSATESSGTPGCVPINLQMQDLCDAEWIDNSHTRVREVPLVARDNRQAMNQRRRGDQTIFDRHRLTRTAKIRQ